MKSRKNIVFIGMMGSGKTSIGCLISKKLKLDFFDVDNYIEEKLDLKITKIFKEKGEKFFREFEEKSTLEILKNGNIVISLGGGAFLNSKIRNEVINNHISFWLKLKTSTILKRIKNSQKRPLAANSSKEQLINLIKKRSNIYAQAMYTIDCNSLSKNEIVNKILNIYETKKANN
tara:strand:- start:2271 stop:2795 length:525 start_codon:yes stop_codon:yes gene_type:complete